MNASAYAANPEKDLTDLSIEELMNIKVVGASSIEEVGECHILFISSSERTSLSKILQMVKNKSVLTVGDTNGFAQSGVIINIIPEENRLGFEINVDAAQRAHLKISSQILKLARIVQGGN